MNDLFSLIGSQPVWIQVVFGLLLFFVGIPLLLILIFGLFSALVSVGAVLFITAVIVGVLYLLWVASEELALYSVIHIGSFFSLSHRKYETVLYISSISIFALEVLVLLIAVYWYYHQKPRLSVNNYRRPVAYIFGQAFGICRSKIRTWYSSTHT